MSHGRADGKDFERPWVVGYYQRSEVLGMRDDVPPTPPAAALYFERFVLPGPFPPCCFKAALACRKATRVAQLACDSRLDFNLSLYNDPPALIAPPLSYEWFRVVPSVDPPSQ
ncbi:hypothetical protein C8R43DRAFT_1138018 [Mycena crocata]|nr:hypothetical protein C8R43DRAFT_1138018 [Mycena crocata]